LVKVHLSKKSGISDLFVAMLYSYVSILLLFIINILTSFAIFLCIGNIKVRCYRYDIQYTVQSL
jgi:hypothetical protein